MKLYGVGDMKARIVQVLQVPTSLMCSHITYTNKLKWYFPEKNKTAIAN